MWRALPLRSSPEKPQAACLGPGSGTRAWRTNGGRDRERDEEREGGEEEGGRVVVLSERVLTICCRYTSFSPVIGWLAHRCACPLGCLLSLSHFFSLFCFVFFIVVCPLPSFLTPLFSFLSLFSLFFSLFLTLSSLPRSFPSLLPSHPHGTL